MTRRRACLDPRREVLDVYLFRSAATGRAQGPRDIDAAVYLAGRPPASAFRCPADLAAALVRALGASAADVVVLDQAPPLLYHGVLRDGVRILARDLAATTTRDGRVLSRCRDVLPQLTRIDAAHRVRIAGGRFAR